VVRERVIKARKIQEARFSGTKVYSNSMMGQKHIKKYCVLDKESRDILLRAVEKLSLSARAYDKVLKVSRTIADLEGCENIAVSHVAEAVQYRAMDRG
jgi:magnesium chelatase family protein